MIKMTTIALKTLKKMEVGCLKSDCWKRGGGYTRTEQSLQQAGLPHAGSVQCKSLRPQWDVPMGSKELIHSTVLTPLIIQKKCITQSGPSVPDTPAYQPTSNQWMNGHSSTALAWPFQSLGPQRVQCGRCTCLGREEREKRSRGCFHFSDQNLQPAHMHPRWAFIW